MKIKFGDFNFNTKTRFLIEIQAQWLLVERVDGVF